MRARSGPSEGPVRAALPGSSGPGLLQQNFLSGSGSLLPLGFSLLLLIFSIFIIVY